MWRSLRWSKFSFVFLGFLLVSCSVVSKRPELQDSENKASATLTEDVSLKADRSELADLRKEIPEEIKKNNDELALIFKMISPGQERDEEPSAIRERFNKALRDRRAKVDKELRRRRDQFNKTEKKTRDEFLKNLKESRESFVEKKRSQEERREFFNDQDKSRNEYFAEERDRRKEFESEISAARKEFDDYAREKQNLFNQEYRAYSTAYLERRNALALKKRADEKAKEINRDINRNINKDVNNDTSGLVQQASGRAWSKMDHYLEEFKRIPNIPAIRLGPSGN